MNKRVVLIGSIVLIVVVATAAFCLCALTSIRRTHMALEFQSRLQKENPTDLTLTVYCVEDEFLLTMIPWDAEILMKNTNDSKVVVCGDALAAHLEIFDKINAHTVKPALKKTDYILARVHYVLESKVNGKLLEVTMFSSEENVLLNGIEVRGNAVFTEVLRPFLPEDMWLFKY